MKFLADESREARLVEHLREHGHDVQFVAELAPGLSDADVLTLANREQRILLTNDKDFSELAFLRRQAHHGIILFRFQGESATAKWQGLDQLLKARSSSLPKAFAVLTENRVRIRPLAD